MSTNTVFVEVVRGGFIVRIGGAYPGDSVHTDIDSAMAEMRERLTRMVGSVMAKEALKDPNR